MKKVFPISRCFSVGTICFLVCLVALLGVQLPGFADDPGVGWHLKSGQWVLQHFRVPRIDPFLSYPLPRLWVSDQWLSDILFFLILEHAGWVWLYSLIIITFVLTFFLVLYRGILRETRLPISSAIAALAAFKVAQIHFILRPVVLSFPLFAWLFLALRDLWNALEAPDSRGEFPGLLKRRGLMFIVLFALWANLHPSFVLGLILVLIFCFAAVVAIYGWAWKLPAESKKQLRGTAGALVLLPLLCIAATLCNPYGVRLHSSIVSLGSSRYFMRLHEEWLSPSLSEYSGQLFALIAGGIVLAALISRRFRARLNLFEVLAFVVFAAGTVDAVRILPYFGIVASVILARCIGAICQSGLLSYRTRRRLVNLGRMEKNAFRPTAVVIIFLGAVIVSSFFGRIPFFSEEFGPTRERYPYDAMKALVQASREETPQAVISVPSWGGFITWWGMDRVRPVLDDRNTLVGEAFHRRYFDEMSGSLEEMRPFLDEVDARYFLLPDESRLANKLVADREFRVIFRDDKSMVIERLRGQSP